MELMQGDQLEITVKIRNANGAVLTDNDLDNVEITVGRITKDCSDGVYFLDETWRFPITQKETFSLSGSTSVQVRIKPKGSNYVRGTVLGNINFDHSESRRIL